MKKKISILIAAIFVLIAVLTCFCACNNDIKYKVSYLTDGNGIIQGEGVQNLKEGRQTSEVTAVPNEGYQFIKWSDDSTQITRSDKVTDNDLTFTAYFEKCKYSVNYSVMGGGKIEGKTTQTVEYGGSATTVTATPLSGWKFVKWSDNGNTNPIRTDTNITRSLNATAMFESVGSSVKVLTYLTDGNGTIEGQTSQSVFGGNNATTVTAIPNDGYEFVKWSDGVTIAERQDLNVTEDITVEAQFKRVYVRYKLNYKLGEADTDTTEFIFYDNDFKTVAFPVPTRELFTFEGWYIGEKQVTDTNGTMVIGVELLQNESKEIYAKWTANENYTYKILLVYVTELDATIPSIKGNGDFDVYYQMSDFDIKICKTVTKQLTDYLNDMLDGLVTFEIDEYFTTAPVGSDSISNGTVVNTIEAINIPEIYNSGLYRDYQSILTVFCMDDNDYEFRTAAGAAMPKYGTVYLETVYASNKINNEPLEYILDINYWRWDSIIITFIHELAHTIEMQMYDAYRYHSVNTWFFNQGIYDTILINKLYYLNEVEIDGQKVGIPLEFWKGEAEIHLPEGW